MIELRLLLGRLPRPTDRRGAACAVTKVAAKLPSRSTASSCAALRRVSPRYDLSGASLHLRIWSVRPIGV
jgi:hypothetical protein